MDLDSKRKSFQKGTPKLKSDLPNLVQFFKLLLPKPYSTSKIKPALTLTLFVLLGISFHNFTVEQTIEKDSPDIPTELFAEIDRKGRATDADKLEDVFTEDNWTNAGFPVVDDKLIAALKIQLDLLENGKLRDGQKAGNLRVTSTELKRTIQILMEYGQSQPETILEELELYKAWGKDKKGNAYFTGYYTPALKVKKTPDHKYKYPLYRYPEDMKGRMPSRREIDGQGVLKGRGLELAYASNPVDVYLMQLQGSGTIEFLETGEKVLLRYAGENGHRYRNIEHYFKKRSDVSIRSISPDGIRRFVNRHPHLADSVLFYNPSYVFFAPKSGEVKGAAQVPLTEDISIAVDSRYFPLGSVILAAMPVTEGGKVTHHQYRILLPQDVGGAIRGPGHVDVYSGLASKGRAKASALHHYGQMWILLPKKQEHVAMK